MMQFGVKTILLGVLAFGLIACGGGGSDGGGGASSGRVPVADGVRSVGVNASPAFYANAVEVNGSSNNHITLHGFDVAYSRGWTGNGSTVLVVDSGLESHPDLEMLPEENTLNPLANVTIPGVVTNATLEEGGSHGTLVTGVVGAKRNGEGMHGVAFDADILFAKGATDNISDREVLTHVVPNAINATAWGRDKGAVVVNLSFGILLDTDEEYPASIIQIEEGSFYSNHTIYGVRGNGDAIDIAQKWKSALGEEMVMVIGAGNEFENATLRPEVTTGIPQILTATNTTTGQLILDGQGIIAGMWYSAEDRRIDDLIMNPDIPKIPSNSIAGNMAGNVCVTWDEEANGGRGECRDAAQIKDFYLLADGAINSTEGGNYTRVHGSSFSAPVISGAVAIIHQMWPHMKGKHIVRLLLDTADNKSIAGYEEHVHGQGLLDMAAATNPVGAIGIPTTGRTGGPRTTLSSPTPHATLNLPPSLADDATLTTPLNIMVLDAFDRDFYFDVGQLVTASDTRPMSALHQFSQGKAVNYFADYMDAAQHAMLVLDVDVPIFGEAANKRHKLTLGFGGSSDHFLGNRFRGILGTSRQSHTLYGSYAYGREGQSGFFAQTAFGVTHVDFDKTGSVLADAELMVSSTATAGYGFELDEAKGSRLGFAISQPITLERARMTYNLPVGRTEAGEVVTQAQVVDFKNHKREIDVGGYVHVPLSGGGGVALTGFTELRTQDLAPQVHEGRVGVAIQAEF